LIAQNDALLVESTRSAYRTTGYALFVIVVVLLPWLVLLSAFPIARTDWFVRKAPTSYLANLGYGLTLTNYDCSVVIYGDSGAMTGVDPRVIENATGLKACNIAEYAGIFMLDQTLIPDQFLLHNKRPQFVVFLFSHSVLAPFTELPRFAAYEAILLHLRFFPASDTWATLIRHPFDTFDFMTKTLRLAARDIVRTGLSPDDMNSRHAHRGLYKVKAPPMSVCPPAPRQIHADAAWIRQLRQKYSRGGTRVIVDVTPVPECGTTYAYYATLVHGLTDNDLERWPLAMFDTTAHFTPAGVTRLSESIARQIKMSAGSYPHGDTSLDGIRLAP
jgi:hypothetical protein